MSKKKGSMKRINLAIPEKVLIQIDEYVEKNFITRTKWFIEAAVTKLTNDKEKEKNDLIERIVKGK